MRKLSVKRKWSFVECASKVTLFVEHADGTVAVAGKNYLAFPFKNGKTIVVDIPDEAVSVRVASSTAETEYVVREGTQDVALVAKPQYAPAMGNPFMIDLQ